MQFLILKILASLSRAVLIHQTGWIFLTNMVGIFFCNLVSGIKICCLFDKTSESEFYAKVFWFFFSCFLLIFQKVVFFLLYLFFLFSFVFYLFLFMYVFFYRLNSYYRAKDILSKFCFQSILAHGFLAFSFQPIFSWEQICARVSSVL